MGKERTKKADGWDEDGKEARDDDALAAIQLSPTTNSRINLSAVKTAALRAVDNNSCPLESFWLTISRPCTHVRRFCSWNCTCPGCNDPLWDHCFGTTLQWDFARDETRGKLNLSL